MRLDKYLKVSRLIKRRTVANEACDSGRVLINDKPAKASANVKEGDIITISFGNKEVKVEVLDVQETVKKEEAKEKDSVKVGESFENDGLKVTAKKAEFGYDGGEYFTPKDGCEYVAVDFTCENVAEKGDKYVSVSDCECYADNSACEQQYIGNSDFVNTNLSPGKNVSFTTYYEVPKDAKKVILEYSASFWTDKKITINLK